MLLFPLAIFTPIVLGLAIIVPIYAALFGACYVIYWHAAPAQAASLLTRWQDGFFILDTYQQLFKFWREHMDSASTVFYTLPLFVIPLIAAWFAFWLTRRIGRKVVELFHLASGR